MQSHILRAIGTVVLLASAKSASAQHAAPDSTLARLVREAISANPSLAAATARSRAAEARIRPAGALADPTVTVGAVDLALPRFAFRQTDFTEIDVQADQTIPWPGTLAARTRSAVALNDASRADIEVRRRDLIGRVAEAYYQLRYVVTARATVIHQQALLDGAFQAALAQYAAGAAPQSDPLQARVAAARLDAEAAGIASREALLRAQLRAFRAVRGIDSIAIAPITVDEAKVLLHGADSAHDGTSPDLAQQPRIAAGRALVASATEAAEAERLGGRPEFMVTARYGARPLGADFFSALVGVRLPIWSRSKQRELVRAAHAEAAAAQSDVAAAQATIQSEWDGLNANAAASRDQLGILVDRVLPVTDATVDAALRDYRLGRANVANVLAADDAAYRIRLDLARLTAEHLTHIVMLAQFANWEVTP